MNQSRKAVAYVGLGSNLDDPIDQVRRALEGLAWLPLTEVTARSPLYTSAPVGPQDQPDFVNAAAAIVTRLSPLALLDQLQALEQRHRRVRERHWGPRTLDLDLLWYDGLRLSTSRLTLPHPEMTNRRFVIEPLSAIAPGLSVEGEPLRVWHDRLRHQPLHPLDV
ncbi:2-amino-4-hydroxy-6-hydroxymethyldihydropteridine diphosphokinase [Salinicola halophilus]|uniref:2-amino-4-hydroxy-6- hydroxymethyldihydropteridine diphosphokinase n=1 Tax=Salinicola halophilus TaxID=184065 RepID=UPI000DA14B53|nr:2-amino-4-hydroxy-6-hydroxymethyldihydropteridine diphosphokinase [Salinicola halophilus]